MLRVGTIRAFFSVVTVAAIIGCLALVPAGAMAGWSPEAVQISPPPNADPEYPFARLRMVSCAAVGACTAAGTYSDSDLESHIQAISKVAGAWQSSAEISMPSGYEDPYPTDISCSAAASCTLVGQLYDSSHDRVAAGATLVDGSWSPLQHISLPSGAEESWLSAVSCTSPGSCAAVGAYVDGAGQSHPMAVIQAGGTWGQPTPVVLPAGTGPGFGGWLGGISCASADSCAAFGSFSEDEGDPSSPMMLSMTSGNWQQAREMPAPNGASFIPRQVSCGGAGSCAVAGSYADGGVEYPAVAEEVGGVWSSSASALPLPVGVSSADHHAMAAAVSCFAAGGCVVTGNFEDTQGIDRAFVARQTAGTWSTTQQLVVPGTPEPTAPYHLVGMTAIDCIAAESCASIGYAYWRATTFLASGPDFAPGAWIVLPEGTQSQEAGALYDVSCGAPGDCAAVGDYVDTEGMTRAMIVDAKAGPPGGGEEAQGPSGGDSAQGSGGSVTPPPSSGSGPTVGGHPGKPTVGGHPGKAKGGKSRAAKKCKKRKGKAKHRCIRKAESKGAHELRSRPSMLASGGKDTCVQAGLAEPKTEEAWVRHPGDRKTQSMFVIADWPSLSGSCATFKRVPSVRFEMQSPSDHARWINMGGFVRPERDPREVEDELEAEKEAEGKSCWEPSDAGKSFVCDVDLRVSNRGGKAYASAPVAPGWPDPDPKLERYRYRCTPGPGTTHVRALIKNVVKDSGAGKAIEQREYRVPVKVKSYPRPPHPGHPKRAALQGPC